MIIAKQTTALSILLALTSILQTTEVAVALCQEEQAVIKKAMMIKKHFCKQIVLVHSRFLGAIKLAVNNLPHK